MGQAWKLETNNILHTMWYIEQKALLRESNIFENAYPKRKKYNGI